jgi:hypothetical protein
MKWQPFWMLASSLLSTAVFVSSQAKIPIMMDLFSLDDVSLEEAIQLLEEVQEHGLHPTYSTIVRTDGKGGHNGHGKGVRDKGRKGSKSKSMSGRGNMNGKKGRMNGRGGKGRKNGKGDKGRMMHRKGGKGKIQLGVK